MNGYIVVLGVIQQEVHVSVSEVHTCPREDELPFIRFDTWNHT